MGEGHRTPAEPSEQELARVRDEAVQLGRAPETQQCMCVCRWDGGPAEKSGLGVTLISSNQGGPQKVSLWRVAGVEAPTFQRGVGLLY